MAYSSGNMLATVTYTLQPEPLVGFSNIFLRLQPLHVLLIWACKTRTSLFAFPDSQAESGLREGTV